MSLLTKKASIISQVSFSGADKKRRKLKQAGQTKDGDHKNTHSHFCTATNPLLKETPNYYISHADEIHPSDSYTMQRLHLLGNIIDPELHLLLHYQRLPLSNPNDGLHTGEFLLNTAFESGCSTIQPMLKMVQTLV